MKPNAFVQTMANFEELKKKFGGGSAPTPENQNKKLKSEREKQKLAITIARARAARYNMTLRSLALKATMEQQKQRKMDRAKLEAAKKEASKYNATSRAIMTQHGRPTRKEDIDNLNKSLNEEVTPLIAQEVMEVVAINQMGVDELIGQTEEKEEEGSEEKGKEVEEEEGEAHFEMSNLQEAVKNNDEGGINRAILTDFLESHAPEELEHLDEKLKEYEGREQLLFDYYTEKYPSPVDAKKEGEIKAQEEIFGAEGEVEKIEDTFIKPQNEDAKKMVEEEREKGYEATIKTAEENPESVEEMSKERDRRRKSDMELVKETKKYESIEEDLKNADLSHQTYIMGGTLEKKQDDDAEKWHVTVEPSAELGSKLKKLGLDEKDAEKIEENVSEML